MRSRLWMLILRELPFPLRWLGTEIVRFVQWVDTSTARLVKGLRAAPAWYFVTSIGAFAVFLTILMFVSLIDETSGHRSQSTSRRPIANLSRQDLEKHHDWSVQDRWRVAHLFVLDKPSPKPHDLQLDSRLMASTPTKSKIARQQSDSLLRRSSQFHRGESDKDLEVRLDLSRPKKAQQSHRMVRGTVLDPIHGDANRRPGGSIRARDSRLLVQASWEFGTECSPTEYFARPSRRPILVPMPDPQTELPRVIARRELPDLSFEMAMIRHFSIVGMFPPGSHVVSHSNHHSFPEHELRFSSELVSHEESVWKRFHPTHNHSASELFPYQGVGTYSPSQFSQLTLDEYEPTLRAVAEVDLNVKLKIPHSVSAGNAHQTGLLISNEGQDQVSRIEVKDLLANLQTVVAAIPDAMLDFDIDPATGQRSHALQREILNLIPGETQELSLKWIPNGHSRQIYRAQVIAHAEVSTSTEVLRPDPAQRMPSIPPERFEHHPGVACDIQHLDHVTVGQDVELELTVRNTGDTMLHRVKVQIDIPDQLSHRDGRAVVFEAGNLPVNGRNRTVLKLTAREAGEAVNLVHVEAVESVEAKGRTVIHVVEHRQKKRPQAATKPLVRQSISINHPVGECCCQKTAIPPLGSND